MNWIGYWFMFPVSVGIAMLATATGTSGATYFSPVFILLLGLDPRVAIGTAIITQVFGIGSGVTAYVRRKLIDYRLATQLLIVAVPLAALGAYFAGQVSSVILKSIFGVGLLAIGAMFLRKPTPIQVAIHADTRAQRKLVASDGQEFRYTAPNQAEAMALSSASGLCMGLIGSGQGELYAYFLLRRSRIPSQVAAATSAFVVALTALTASLGYAVHFVRSGGDVLTQVQSLVVYTVPGVIIGGQLGPLLAARLDTHKVERLLAIIFIAVGIITLWTALAPRLL